MSEDLPELTERQKEVLHHLADGGASKAELAAALDVGKRTIQGHLERIRKKDVGVAYDSDANSWYIDDDRREKLRQISTQHKSSITRDATGIIEAEESTLLRRLKRTDPLTTEPKEWYGCETFCAILSDLHFGDLVEKEFYDSDRGEYVTRTVYNSEIAADAVATFGEKLLHIREMLSPLIDFDDCYLFLLGDIATGEGIYEGQVYDTHQHLADQTTESVSALYQLCRTLADEFETLQVRGVLGNHGRTRASASHGANTDLITYRWLDDRLRDAGFDNVDFAVGEAHHHLNTQVRGWNVHLRHGQDGKPHVDETSYSQKLWRGWQDEHEYDIAMKGHHHVPSYHKVLNRYPVFAAPSPKPGGEFASRIGSPDTSRTKDLGWVFGSSSDRPVTWQFLLDDR